MEPKKEGVTASGTAEAIIVINNLPIGSIMPFAGNDDSVTALNAKGWLLCNGDELKVEDYKDLYSVIGNAAGGSASHFFLPDMRGMFLRGTDGTAGHDPDAAARTAQRANGNEGNKVLTRQGDDIKSHVHPILKKAKDFAVYKTNDQGGHHFPRVELSTGQTEQAGGNESRPKNVNVNYIIFAKAPVHA